LASKRRRHQAECCHHTARHDDDIAQVVPAQVGAGRDLLDRVDRAPKW